MSGFRPGLLPALLVLLLVPGLLWLGFWQLDRGEQKRALLARQEARQQAEPLAPQALDYTEDPAYSRVHLQGRFDAEHSFLLDSRTRDGQVGVELLQPFHDDPSGRWVLVNRGWIPWPDRRIPPRFDTPDGALKLAAWVYAPSQQPFLLARRMVDGWPKLTSYVDVKEIWQLLGRDGVPFELRLAPAGGLPGRLAGHHHDPGKHLGYAVQWFALAAALLGLFVYLGIHRAKEIDHERHEPDHRSA